MPRIFWASILAANILMQVIVVVVQLRIPDSGPLVFWTIIAFVISDAFLAYVFKKTESKD